MEQLEENVLKDTIVMVLLEMKLHAQEEPIILMKECLLVCLVLLDIFAIILLWRLLLNVLKDHIVLLELLALITSSLALLVLMVNLSDLLLLPNALSVHQENTVWEEEPLLMEIVMLDTFVPLEPQFQTREEEQSSTLLLLWLADYVLKATHVFPDLTIQYLVQKELINIKLVKVSVSLAQRVNTVTN